MKTEKQNSRRKFLGNIALLGAASSIGTLGSASILSSCTENKKGTTYIPLRNVDQMYLPSLTDKAIAGQALKAGVIGCGGRGSGAAFNFLAAADNVTISALGDVFQEKVDGLKASLKEKKNIDVAIENCFVGFDSYQKVIDSDVDIVILTTPPAFRPEHFKYAVEKGKHAFLEKPVAVDPVGYRSIVASSKQANAKGLCVITGTQRHHERSYVESYKKIQEGLIGEITGANVYWNQGMLWYKYREENWSDMEWMIRDWVNWKWLSGDHIVEQHVHNIDVFNWFSGKKTIKAVAFGARQRRLTGDQYDMFSVDFEYEGGIHVHSMCRQIDGCATNVSETIQGTIGSWSSKDMTIRDLKGKVIWQYNSDADKTKFKQHDPYTLEHVNLITHIRNHEPITQAEDTAISTLCAIMARESAYTGSEITWDQISASELCMLPTTLELGVMDMTLYQVEKPGSGEEDNIVSTPALVTTPTPAPIPKPKRRSTRITAPAPKLESIPTPKTML